MTYLKFYSPTCQPCKVADLLFKSKGIESTNINVAEDQEMAIKYNVRGVPTVVIIDEEGNEIQRAVGLPEIEKL